MDQKKSDKEIIDEARKRFELAVESETESRKEELDDQKFMIGEQWPLDVRNARQQDARPCLTINRIPQFVRQITNDQRQNRPSIKVNPVDDTADVDTAKVLQGMVRHIEYSSAADTAYDTAFDSAVRSGLGYFRLVTEYSDNDGFDQEILVKRIKNRFSVYVDPFYEEPDGSDIEWGFIFDDLSKDEFETQYPDSQATTMADWKSLGNDDPDWFQENSVRVAEYYYKDYELVDLVLLSDRTILKKQELPKNLPEGIQVISERSALVPNIKWCKINGLEILERTEIPGEYIPIIPVIGDEYMMDGRKVYKGIIRDAKDPQRMYNYWKSAETETIALAPRAPFIGFEGQFEGHEAQWKTANVKNHAYLEVKPTTIGGVPAPIPQRNVYEPPVQAITQAGMQASEDMKATTGVYDASLGNRSNETSGVAIQRRNAQSQTSNFHFMDNMSRSLRHAGRIMITWIPYIYDGQKAVRIIGDDGSVDIIKVNQMFQESGEMKGHFLDMGRYDTTVDVGPSHATKRQEAVASMLDLTRTAPQLMQVAGDLMVRNMDWPGAQEIADRIKKTLPPNLTDDKDKDQPQIPPQAQQQMQQMQQMIQMLTKEVNEASEVIKTKRMELESRERIALVEAETQLKLALIKDHAADSQLMFRTEVDQINRRLELLNINEPIDPSAAAMPGGPQQQPSAAPQMPGGQQ